MKTAFPFLLLTLAGCDEAPQPLDAGRLSALLSQDMILSFDTIRFSGRVTLFADESAHLVIEGLGRDDGTWWLQGDRVCSRWKQALRKRTRCVQVRQYSDGTYAAIDGTTGFSLGQFSLEPIS